MLLRAALRCRHAAALSKQHPQTTGRRRPASSAAAARRRSTAFPCTHQRVIESHGCLQRAPAPRGCSSSRSRTGFSEVEQRVWWHIQHGRFHEAVALSWIAEHGALQPLTLFMLAKRQFRIECLYAGVYAYLETCHSAAAFEDENLYILLFAALLADRSQGLLTMYGTRAPEARRAAMDTIFAAATAFHYLIVGDVRRARTCLADLSGRERRAIEEFAANHHSALSRIPKDLVGTLDAVWMLRMPTQEFSDIAAASSAVNALVKCGIVPDVEVAATLVSSAVRCQQPSLALSIYTSRRSRGLKLADSAAVDLHVLREELGRRYPRMHYDMVGSLVRCGSLGGALAVARAVRSRHLFHLLLSLWSTHRPGDVQGIIRITSMALASIEAKLLHSTHHLVISQMLAALDLAPSSQARVVLRRTLDLHRALVPRLESPSVAAANQLMRACVDHQMGRAAFVLFRDLERRAEQWPRPWNQFANEAVYATLGECLGRKKDTRSIAHLIVAATRSQVATGARFYTAIICGLAQVPVEAKRKIAKEIEAAELQQLSEGEAPRGLYYYHNLAKRAWIVGVMLASMRKHGIEQRPKALYAAMYVHAILGEPVKALRIFRRLKRQDKSEVGWGILMYAHVRARNVKGALDVLKRAREWVLSAKATVAEQAPAKTTSHLVNMALTVLINSGDGKSALALLDMCLLRVSDPDSKELPTSAGDPITLGLIIRTLLDNHRFTQAVQAYDEIHAEHQLAESPAQLRPLLDYSLGRGSAKNALTIAQRVLQLRGSLTDLQWLHLLRLCSRTEESDQEAAVGLYRHWCKQHGIDALAKMGRLLGRDSEVARQLGAVALPSRAAPTSSPPSGWSSQIVLYRAFLKEIERFPKADMRKKLRHNVRFVYELYRDLGPSEAARIKKLVADGREQLRWLRSWRDSPGAANKC
ncbi:hypothetical protein GGF46_003920 [Coemansia sp. RSA 552]|nr:hypothetical protein GGF46_003920 [Coemansia sp. RSA 552]